MGTRFTKGPWSAVQYQNTSYYTVRQEHKTFGINAETIVGSDVVPRFADACLIAAAPELYEMLDKINMAFYTRTTRAEWLKLMEQTKPLLQKARGGMDKYYCVVLHDYGNLGFQIIEVYTDKEKAEHLADNINFLFAQGGHKNLEAKVHLQELPEGGE